MHGLRAEFPVLDQVGYLNAGTNGPVPARAARAAATAVELQCENGRADEIFFQAALKNLDELRGRVARIVNADKQEIALTGSTTDGVNAILNGLDLQPGDEVVSSDEEHPGLSAPLAVARERRGIQLHVAPFDELANAVTPRTRLIACSHVSWMTGRVADVAALAASDALLLLDGAQGLGAIPLDVKALDCDFYAASGQKWLCGPIGTGYLYARAERTPELAAPWPGYTTLAGGDDPFAPQLHDDARRFDVGFPASEQVAWALAALDVLEEAGLQRVQRRAVDLAARLADELAARKRRVASRGESTLVSFVDDEPEQTVERLRNEGLVTRAIPGTPYVRVSVGGWSSEEELERLLALVA